MLPPSPSPYGQLPKTELSIAARGGGGVACGEPHRGVGEGCGEEGGGGCGGGKEGVSAVREGAARGASWLLATRLKMVQ